MADSSPLIDCDVHCTVPAVDVLVPRMSEEWHEFMWMTPYKQPMAKAVMHPSWVPALNTDESSVDHLREAVLGDADLAILTCYHGVESFTHPYLGPALATAVNRWVADDWLGADDRLLGSAGITPQHTDAAVAEVHRVADDGRFVQVYVTARAQQGYGSQRYWPIWEAAAERGLVVAMNMGGSVGTPSTAMNWLDGHFEEYACASTSIQAQLLSLVCSGVFERYPKLMFSVTETGWTWLPSLLWRMDQEWKALRREIPWVQEPPSAYVRRHFRFTTQPTDAPPDSRHLHQIYDQLGSDEILMYASDHPRRPGGGIDALVPHLTADQVDGLRWRTAATAFGLGERLGVTTGV